MEELALNSTFQLLLLQPELWTHWYCIEPTFLDRLLWLFAGWRFWVVWVAAASYLILTVVWVFTRSLEYLASCICGIGGAVLLVFGCRTFPGVLPIAMIACGGLLVAVPVVALLNRWAGQGKTGET